MQDLVYTKGSKNNTDIHVSTCTRGCPSAIIRKSSVVDGHCCMGCEVNAYRKRLSEIILTGACRTKQLTAQPLVLPLMRYGQSIKSSMVVALSEAVKLFSSIYYD
eukprot:44269-Eustigmatos_ZCMA.PRE.1